MRTTTRFRELMASGRIIVAPGAFDALSARLAAEAGFDAVYMSGSNSAAAFLGIPDLGLMTATEMAMNARAIANAITVPLVCDGDTGYGNALNVQRTVREFEQAGAAAIQLEDQDFPKRCGHFDGKTLIPVEEAAAKIRAACDARRDDDFVIIARTDARTVAGLDDAINRANAYRAAGADMIFVESPMSVDEFREIARRVNAPLMANMPEGGKSPLLSSDELEAIGFSFVIWPASMLRAAITAIKEVLTELKTQGTTQAMVPRMATWDDRQRAVDLDGYLALEQRYAAEPVPVVASDRGI